MEPATKYIEMAEFFWGIAFTLNLIMGCVCFSAVIRKAVPSWAAPSITWVGWFAFATALSQLINLTISPDYPFAYHQIGLLLETMINLGILSYLVINVVINWQVTGDDWKRMQDTKRQIIKEKYDDPK